MVDAFAGAVFAAGKGFSTAGNEIKTTYKTYLRYNTCVHTNETHYKRRSRQSWEYEPSDRQDKARRHLVNSFPKLRSWAKIWHLCAMNAFRPPTRCIHACVLCVAGGRSICGWGGGHCSRKGDHPTGPAIIISRGRPTPR